MKNFLLLFLTFAIQLFGNNKIQAQASCNLPAPTNLTFIQTGNTTGFAAWNPVSTAIDYQVKFSLF